jgi:hypothetical protein
MPTPDPKSYADQWVRAWNAHDIGAVLDDLRNHRGQLVNEVLTFDSYGLVREGGLPTAAVTAAASPKKCHPTTAHQRLNGLRWFDEEPLGTATSTPNL